MRPDRRGIVIGEGVSVVQRLIASPYPVRAVVGVAAKMSLLAADLAEAGLDGYVIDKWMLSEVVGFRVTRGVLASAERLPPADPEEVLHDVRGVVVLEQLNDFENLGALFRNAAAFGVGAVLLDPKCADPLYRRSVRVSMGHALRVPFAVTSGSTVDTIGLLRAHGFEVLALTPRADADPLRSVAVPERWAVVLGAEGPGLADATLAAADRLVRIPMAGGVDSLNVATAGAVAFAHLTG